MSFNFNWSPLIADTSKAREMLTAALNKSPKPPIIVDDILVSELNLGATPPDLEILEIGDLAEDRFRGIFKMSYTGDAFLTLKTKVQGNPMCTFLSDKPDFTSPGPTAAGSGLTIPVAITLSEIRLSGFVILVFSKNKGMTLVFRNDPLESLKVSSTFDSIPFVRDYLQREIEKQLRNLFMEDLPAILHRLSLRLWSPEFRELDDRLLEKQKEEAGSEPIDPLSSPPQGPGDWGEDVPTGFSLDSENYHASFSQKNLLRLAALNDSHRTLSLFTPPIRDAVFRAWAGDSERGNSGRQTPLRTTLPASSRANSYLGSAASTSSLLSDPATEHTSRTSTSYTFNSTSRGYGHRPRKAKKRVINLRKSNIDNEDVLIETASLSTTPDPSIAPSSAPSVIYEENMEDVLRTPPRTPRLASRRHRASSVGDVDATPRASMVLPDKPVLSTDNLALSNTSQREARSIRSPEKWNRDARSTRTGQDHPPAYTPPDNQATIRASKKSDKSKPKRPSLVQAYTEFTPKHRHHHSTSSTLLRTLSNDKLTFAQYPNLASPFSPGCESSSSTGVNLSSGSSGIWSTGSNGSGNGNGVNLGILDQMVGSASASGGILEQAWLNKIARDVARKVSEERARQDAKSLKSNGVRGVGGEGAEVDGPPPAYAA